MTEPRALNEAELAWLRRRRVPEATAGILHAAGHPYTDMPALHRAAEASDNYDDAISVACAIGPRSITSSALQQVMASPDATGARRVENAGVNAKTITLLVTYGELTGASELLDAGVTAHHIERVYASGPTLLSARVMKQLVNAGMTGEQLADLLDEQPELYDRIVTSVLDIGLTPGDIRELARIGLRLDDLMLILPTHSEGTLAGLEPDTRITAAVLTLVTGMLVSEAVEAANALATRPWRDLFIRLLLETDNPCYVSALVARRVEQDANATGLGEPGRAGRWLPIACLDSLETREEPVEDDLSAGDRQALRNAGLSEADVAELMKAGMSLDDAIELVCAWGTSPPESALTTRTPSSDLPWSAPSAHWWAAAANRRISTDTIRHAIAAIGYSGAGIALALGGTNESIDQWKSKGVHPAVALLLTEFGYSDADVLHVAHHRDVTTILAAASMGLPADRIAGLTNPDGTDLTRAWPSEHPLSVDVLTIMSVNAIALSDPAVINDLGVLTDTHIPLEVMRAALTRHASRLRGATPQERAYHPIEWDLLLTIAEWDPSHQRARLRALRPETSRHGQTPRSTLGADLG